MVQQLLYYPHVFQLFEDLAQNKDSEFHSSQTFFCGSGGFFSSVLRLSDDFDQSVNFYETTYLYHWKSRVLPRVSFWYNCAHLHTGAIEAFLRSIWIFRAIFLSAAVWLYDSSQALQIRCCRQPKDRVFILCLKRSGGKKIREFAQQFAIKNHHCPFRLGNVVLPKSTNFSCSSREFFWLNAWLPNFLHISHL